MPKVGMEPIRREALVRATIAELGAAGTLDVTVSQIARRAGVSSALAHHYFGGKDQIFLAAMRRILSDFGTEVRRELRAAAPRDRAAAIVRACFAGSSFTPSAVGAWMCFYGMAQTN
ncbi:MAG: transcriptional regulator BetI, partial [Pseudodonghicola sp.]